MLIDFCIGAILFVSKLVFCTASEPGVDNYRVCQLGRIGIETYLIQSVKHKQFVQNQNRDRNVVFLFSAGNCFLVSLNQ